MTIREQKAKTTTSVTDSEGLAEAFDMAERSINEVGQAASAPATTATPATPAAPATKTTAPAKKTDSARELAAFKTFVEKSNLAHDYNGKVYLLADAWQFLCALKGVVPTYESAEDIRTTKVKRGNSYVDITVSYVTTICRLINKKTGVEVSRSTMIASSEESFLKDKAPHAVWGMSQTRAMARAVKNVYGYVARAAGFQTTPWEEISQ